MAQIRRYRAATAGPVAEAIARAFGEGIQPMGAAAPPFPRRGSDADDDPLAELEGLADIDWEALEAMEATQVIPRIPYETLYPRRALATDAVTGRLPGSFDNGDVGDDLPDDAPAPILPMPVTMPMSVGWEAYVVPAPRRAWFGVID